MRATDELLDSLHALQGTSLLEELRRTLASGDGVPPALFAQVNKYLKDNGVDRAVIPGDTTDLLKDECPEFEDNVVPIGER